VALRRVLIANRGEIAVRVIKACFDEEVESVLAVSQADQGSLGAQLADQVGYSRSETTGAGINQFRISARLEAVQLVDVAI